MNSIDPVERHLFLEGIFLRYGYDFRLYSEASLNRRLEVLLGRYQADSLIEILRKVLASSDFFHEVLPLLTINTTEFFRDPEFFKALRDEVFPVLKTYSRLVIWTAGCSTGEEVLSLAILLKEEDLLSRSTIYATDINTDVLKKAKEGIYDIESIETFNKNYAYAGGRFSPSDYYTADYGLVKFNQDLLESVIFTSHNLVTDSAFVEAHLILCRNVLIYFTKDLQGRVLDLFTRSLVYRGFLGIGSKESLSYSSSAKYFESVDKHNIHRLRQKNVAELKVRSGVVR